MGTNHRDFNAFSKTNYFEGVPPKSHCGEGGYWRVTSCAWDMPCGFSAFLEFTGFILGDLFPVRFGFSLWVCLESGGW